MGGIIGWSMGIWACKEKAADLNKIEGTDHYGMNLDNS